MGRGLHEHFDDAAKDEVPGDFMRALKHVDRRRLLRPKDKP
jgi:hypothetical protein